MPKPENLPLRALKVVVAANALQFYDFLLFGFFASQIGAAFFPGGDTTSSLLLTLATVGVGFGARLLGSVMIGTLGDTWGRKPAMLLSFGLMGVSVVGFSLTPSFARIGWIAPLLAMVFHMLQGLALGGEVGPVTALLLEVAPPRRRGLYVALQNVTQYASTLLAITAALLLGQLLPHALATWGWRIAFVGGALVMPLAAVIRRRLPETLDTTRFQRRRSRERMLALLWQVFLAFCMLASATIGTYTMNYLASFAVGALGLSSRLPFLIIAVTAASALLGALTGGVLGDRLGRKPVMITGHLVLLGTALPWFFAMTRVPALDMVLAAGLVMAFCVGLSTAAIMASVTENMPANLRAGSVGILYALAIASFGGTAQLLVTWLVAETGSALAPAWYLSGATLLGLMAMWGVRESAPVKTGEV